MPLREELRDSGDWLFRHRSYLPLIPLALILAQLPGFTYLADGHGWDLAWEGFCLLLGLIGLAIRVHVVGHAPRDTSGRNTQGQDAAVLNTTGWYSVSRHPLYLGNLLMWLAVGLFLHRWWVGLLTILVFALYYERIMFAEEEWLRLKFGDVYLEWAGRTPAILPKFRLWRRPAGSFSLRKALRREYSGFFGLLAVLTVLEVLGDWVATGRFQVDPIWAVLFCIGAVTYCGLLLLKRYTRLLHAD